MGVGTFDRGIHPEYHKELTSGKRIESAALPKTVIIPLQQHAGAPCVPLVKKGDTVVEGQKIGDVKAFVSAPVHASISGKVKDVELSHHPVGVRTLSVIIEGDGAVKQWPVNERVSLDSLTPDAIRGNIREAGIVGMGGAAFPSSVKLQPPKGVTIDIVILNGCECEPYLTADHRLMVEEPEKVVWGLTAIMKAVGASKGIIGIEENKPDAIEAVQKAASNSSNVSVAVLAAKYPQGAEKMLIQAAVKRKVPVGKLPLDAGVLVNNVGTAVAFYEALNWGKPLIERVLTVSGNAVSQPKNLRVRIGASFEDILNQCGGLVREGTGVIPPSVEVLNGGPMMGIAQGTLNVPVVKGTSGITALKTVSLKREGYGPCIKCAACVEVCPMGLMPYRLGDYGRAQRTVEFKDWAGLSCIECGCCSYVCPAKRPLVHWIRVAKFKARTETVKVAK
ncbi:MAG: electron transport complex subunit RsxC [Deltaproteobacteria bacterium]|nr:electron transport complex subunit RsxC [Deltaproteobacteria bacterium]